MTNNDKNNEITQSKNYWEMGYKFEADIPIIGIYASKASLIHKHPFLEFSRLILKFTANLTNKKISTQDLEQYFCLPLTLAKTIFQSLIEEEFLLEINPGANQDPRYAMINPNITQDLDQIPSKKIIRPILYNFCTCPRLYINNYLIVEKHIRSRRRKTYIPENLDLSLDSVLQVRKDLEIPDRKSVV